MVKQQRPNWSKDNSLVNSQNYFIKFLLKNFKQNLNKKHTRYKP